MKIHIKAGHISSATTTNVAAIAAKKPRKNAADGHWKAYCDCGKQATHRFNGPECDECQRLRELWNYESLTYGKDPKVSVNPNLVT